MRPGYTYIRRVGKLGVKNKNDTSLLFNKLLEEHFGQNKNKINIIMGWFIRKEM